MTRRLKQLLVAVIGGALSLFMIFLGLWQAEVFQSQAQGSAEQRAAGAPRDLEPALDEQNEAVGDLYGRRVTAKGSYLPNMQVLVGTEYPLQVVNAFRTVGGRSLTVVRGTVTKGQEIPAPPKGQTTVQGVILPSQAKPEVPTAADVPAGTEGTVRLEQLAQRWPAPMVQGFVTLEAQASQQQGLGAKKPEIPDVGGGKERNRGYALQWWAFAIFGVAATWVGVRSIKE